MRLQLLLSLPIIYLLFPIIGKSQNEGDYSARAYYFPVQEMFEPKVYVYENQVDNTFQYWVMKSLMIEEDTLFSTEVYDDDFELVEISNEIIQREGSEMVGLTLIIPDNNGIKETASCIILEDRVFSFKIPEDDMTHFRFLTSSRYTTELLHNKIRRLRSLETMPHDLNDQLIDCLVYEDDKTDKYLSELDNTIVRGDFERSQ